MEKNERVHALGGDTGLWYGRMGARDNHAHRAGARRVRWHLGMHFQEKRGPTVMMRLPEVYVDGRMLVNKPQTVSKNTGENLS